MENIDIIQLNNQKRIDSMNYLRLLCNKSKLFIAMGQECNVKQGKPAGLDPSCKLIYNSDEPRAYIYHSNSLNTWECKDLGDRDICSSIWLTGNNMTPKIMLVSMYWESRVKKLLPKLLQTVEYCVCLLYTSPSPRDLSTSRMPSSA